MGIEERGNKGEGSQKERVLFMHFQQVPRFVTVQSFEIELTER